VSAGVPGFMGAASMGLIDQGAMCVKTHRMQNESRRDG
jgi:hypothetical protein